MAETGTCWGFGFGDGWFDIIAGLCAEITRQVKAGTMPPVIASQVKEKAGHLRFYIRGRFKRNENPEVHSLIALAQQKAERICHECGKSAELTKGTTGLPKPIVHGHGGPVLMALALKGLHKLMAG